MTTEEFVKTLTTELKAISQGNSKHTNGAILFDPKKLPFCAVLERFAGAANLENLKEVVKVAEQDFGIRFGNFVGGLADQLKTDVFKEEVAAPKPPAPTIPFRQALYNELTTILSRGRERAIDQRLLDVMMQDVGRLADVLEKKVAEVADERARNICALAVKMLGEEIDALKVQLKTVGDTAREASINSAGNRRIG